MVFTKLWQRIFLYSLMLVLVSLGTSFLLRHQDFKQRRGAFALEFSGEIRRSLDGQPLDAAAIVLRVFNKSHHKMWIEDAGGGLLAGERLGGLSGADWAGRIRDPLEGNGIRLWQTGLEEPHFLAVGELTLGGRPLTFYNAFTNPPRPPLHTLFIQWLLTTAIIGGVLSFWMARRVSRPLRLLERELSELRNSNILGDVTVSGNDEIAAVARAVNQLMDSLRRHIKSMRDLAVNISHELRSPLTRMALSADMVRQGLFLHPFPRGKGGMSDEHLRREATVLLAKKHFAALEEELAHMDNVIGSTLLNSKLDLQAPETLTDSVNFSRLCLGAADRFEPQFRQAGLAFSCAIAPGLHLTGDETLLLQLLSNLLDNAVKYTPQPGGQVRMALVKRSGSAFFTLENTFAPVPPENLDRMFEPFYRSDQRTGTGVGLGLSLVQKIAALHRGEVMAVSTDRGICICLQLPLRGNTASYQDAPVQ